MTRRRTSIEAVTADIEDRGVKSAYAALVEICEDRTASAQARAASAIAIFRAVGLHDGKKHPPPDEDAPAMTAEQWRQVVSDLTQERDKLDVEIAARQLLLDDDTEADIFA